MKIYKSFIGKEVIGNVAYYIKKNLVTRETESSIDEEDVYNWICDEVKKNRIPLLTIAPENLKEVPLTKKILKRIVDELKEDLTDEEYLDMLIEVENSRGEYTFKNEYHPLSSEKLNKIRIRLQIDPEMKNYINPFKYQPNMS